MARMAASVQSERIHRQANHDHFLTTAGEHYKPATGVVSNSTLFPRHLPRDLPPIASVFLADGGTWL
jgi:hypothetical protein